MIGLLALNRRNEPSPECRRAATMLSYGGRCDGRWQNCFVIETLGLRHPVAANIYHVCFTKLLRTKNSLHMWPRRHMRNMR
jgi:hypothetical protein